MIARRINCQITIIALLCISADTSLCHAEDWPTFRGSQRDAISGESGLLNSWGETGPKLVWTASGCGSGYASPTVSAGRVYTLGDRESGQFVTCFDAQSGKLVWEQQVGKAWMEHRRPGEASWNGARGTPTIDGQHLYVITAHGDILCMQTKDGTTVWQKSLENDLHGVKKDKWGYSESPLVDGSSVLCTPGGAEATVVSLDKATGELLWRCQRPNDVGAGHSSIVISYVGGRKVYVQNTGGGPIGVDARSGELLWSYDVPPPVAFIPSPVIKDDYVLSVAGYNTGGALLQQVANSDGSISVKEIYGLNKELDNKHGGVILVGQHILGGFSDTSQVYCADFMTGNRLWRERGSGDGSTSVIFADGKLIIRHASGIVALAKVDAQGITPVSSFKTPGSGEKARPSWAHPVISNGKLLLREGNEILCYDIQG